MIELNSLFRTELYLMFACLLLCEWPIKRLFALIAFAKESLESVVSDCVFFVIYPYSDSKDSFLLYSVIRIFV